MLRMHFSICTRYLLVLILATTTRDSSECVEPRAETVNGPCLGVVTDDGGMFCGAHRIGDTLLINKPITY